MVKRISLALLFAAAASMSFAADKKVAAPTTKTAMPVTTASKNQPAQRTGVVDFEKIMRECEQARDVSVRVQEEATKRQNDFAKKVQDYQKQSKDGKIKKEDAQKQEAALGEEARNIQMEIEQLSAIAQQELFTAVQTASEEVAKKHQLDAFIPKFLFAKESVDFTDEIIAEVNRAYRAKKGASKFKSGQQANKAAQPTAGKKA